MNISRHIFDFKKPFKLVVDSMLRKGDIMTIAFCCLDCGCDKVYRQKRQYSYGYLEGFYNCLNCKKQVSYMDDDFVHTYTSKSTQLQMFQNHE